MRIDISRFSLPNLIKKAYNKRGKQKQRIVALFLVGIMLWSIALPHASIHIDRIAASVNNFNLRDLILGPKNDATLKREMDDRRKAFREIQVKEDEFDLAQGVKNKELAATTELGKKSAILEAMKIVDFKDQTKDSTKPKQFTQNARSYQGMKGGTLTETSSFPLNYKAEDQTFKPIEQESKPFSSQQFGSSYFNPTKLFNATDEGFTNTEGEIKVYYGKVGNQSSGVGLSYDNESLKINPRTQGAVNPKKLTKDKQHFVEYKNVWKNVDLVYEYKSVNLKESIVINGPLSETTFVFDISGAKLGMQNADGEINLEGPLSDKIRFSSLSVNVNKKGIISEAPAKQYVGADGKSIVIEIDSEWLSRQDKESYPIVIDPSAQVVNYISGSPYKNYTAYKSDGYACGSSVCYVNTGGLYDVGAKYWQTVMHVPYDQVSGRQLLGAYLYMPMSTAPGWNGTYDNRTVYVNWANCSGYNCVGAGPTIAGTVGADGTLDVTSLIQWMKDNVGMGGSLIVRGEATTSSFKSFNDAGIRLYLNTNQQPSLPTPELPSTSSTQQALVTSTEPQLKVSKVYDPDGDQVRYQFILKNMNDAVIWASSMSPSRQVIIPEGYLQDAGKYKWTYRYGEHYSGDSYWWLSGEQMGGNFVVDLLRGKDKAQTYDSLGALSVSLNNGNVYTSLKTHSLQALGGEIGLNLDYNSPYLTKKGLQAEYYSNSSLSGLAQYRRIEPNINYDWDLGSPVAGVIPEDNFSVRWTGYFVAPVSGEYTFGGEHDDSFSVTLKGAQIYSGGCCGLGWSQQAPVWIEAGEAAEIAVTHAEASSSAYATLKVKGAVAEQTVPADWLRTKPLPTDSVSGLQGHYYYDNATHTPAETDKFLVRNDPSVNFAWGEASPTPGTPADFFARWEGFFTAPTTGNYKFGVGGDDGVKVTVNGVERANLWSAHGYLEAYDSTGFTLNAGQKVPITMEYFDAGGTAQAKLLLNGPNGVGVIDSQYLTHSTKVLPSGWNISADSDGNLAFERLSIRQNGDALLSDSDGVTWLYSSNGGYGYTPPSNQDAILIKNNDGTHTLTDAGGRVYLFDITGTLVSTSMPIDDRKPAALKYEYATQNGQVKLKKIIDQVNPTRFGTLYYSGESGCREAYGGLDNGPLGMLCGFETTDGKYTQLMYYDGQVSLVSKPGYDDTSLVYTSNGTLSGYRDSATEEAIFAGQVANDDNTWSWIWYDSLGRSDGMESHKPSASLDRTMHWIQYLPTATKLHHLNVNNPVGYSKYIEFDEKLRTTKSCDNLGKCSTTEFDPVKDLVLSTTDPLDFKTTTIYDDEDRPIRSYGAAPKTWFQTNREPLAAYASQIPRKDIGYDEGIVGPLVAYYEYEGNINPKRKLFGAPELHTTGVNTATGNLQKAWTAAPISVDAAREGWGASLTGKLRLPTAGTYQIKASHDDGVRIWVDDKLLVDDWSNGAYRDSIGSFAHTVGAVHRIRIDYYNVAGTVTNDATLNMFLKQDGGFDWTGDWTNYLKPGYGLTTSTLTYDQQVGNVGTQTSFLNSAYGIVKDITVDPTGLAYKTSMGYESTATTYYRQLSKTSSGGSVTQYNHWGALDTADNPCTTQVEAYKQAGFVKGKTGPDPDGTGPSLSRVTEMRYDDSGQLVATKTGTDPWTCMWYEDRGRMTYLSVPTVGTRLGRDVQYNYAPSGNPLQTQVSDSSGATVTTVDLFGRTVGFSDISGNQTTTTYESNGQVSARSSKLGLENYVYDDYGQLITYKLDNVILSTISYDSFGRVNQIQYPTIKDPVTNQILKINTPTRDQLNRITGISYLLPSGQTLSSGVTRSQSGVITDESINGVDLSPGNSSYVYDKAGRLTTARVAGHTFGYGFGTSNTGCTGKVGNNVNAGKNFNRTHYTVDGVTNWYCYDNADKLIGSNDTKLDAPTYDNHGNTLSLGTGTNITSFSYDQSDRNMKIESGVNKTEYKRDHDNRIAERKVTTASGTTTYYYGSTGGADYTFMYTDNATKQVVEKYLTLPGGITYTVRPTETTTANKTKVSLRSLRGETIVMLNGNGVNETGVLLYEPFGIKIAPTASFSSANPSIVFAAQSTLPDNAKGGQSRGWAGSAKRSNETNFALQPIQMGARVYIPSMGRFISVDPVDGGTQNDYAYPLDPVNSEDYSGEFLWIPVIMWAVRIVVAIAPAVIKVASGAVKTAGSAITKAATSIANTASNTYSAASSWVRSVGSSSGARSTTSSTVSNATKKTSPPVNNVVFQGAKVPNSKGVYQGAQPDGRIYSGMSTRSMTTRMSEHRASGKFSDISSVWFNPMPDSSRIGIRIAEQKLINGSGGVGHANVGNKINSISPKYWDDLNIDPPN